MSLNADQTRRYARHLILPEVGPEGQRKICSAAVLCIGAGGLGSPVLLYLAAMGVGRLGVVDEDRVDPSNLQRQVLHGTPDVGRLKTESARDALHRLNPHCQVELHSARLSAANALDLVRAYDVVVDGTDNFTARYLVNDACVFLQKPDVSGAIFRFEGQASIFAPHLGGPCYRCLFPEPPPAHLAPSCAEAGVIGVLPGLLGCIQAAETLKLILGIGRSLVGRLLLVEALGMRFREVKVRPDPACALCGPNPRITEITEYAPTCASPARPTSDTPMNNDEVSVQDLKRALDDPGLGIQIIDVREPNEQQVARLEGVPLLPLATLPTRLHEFDPDRPLYVFCRSGVRSLRAVQFLKQQGFAQARSVHGGILAWSDQIDPRVPKY